MPILPSLMPPAQLSPSEVYETSFYLSVIFDSRAQPASIIPHLVPVYEVVTCPTPLKQLSLVLSLLYHLATAYPSQTTYHQHLKTIPNAHLPKDSKARKWLSHLASSLRTRNYSKFERLSQTRAIAAILAEPFDGVLDATSLSVSRSASSREFAQYAILVTMETLRSKARESFWTVVRSAYRELHCAANQTSPTGMWLSRSLCLPSLLSEDVSLDAEGWLLEQARQGQTRKADGVDGKWIVCKVR